MAETERTALVGPSAVVTGVSNGIGRAICVALAEAGANIVGCYYSDHQGAETVRQQVEATGQEAIIVQADTGDAATASILAGKAMERWGSVDVWVNNAARLMVKPLIETTDDDWHGLLAANLHGYFYGSREAARSMYPQRRGRIINITSAADVLVVANLGAYIAAKGGILGLTKTLALEAAEHDVTVNAISPGAIDTPLNLQAYTPAVRRTYEHRIPLGRIGSEEEIADVVVFMASHASRYLTGQEIVVDGGLVINGTVGHAMDD
ncbi:MAG: SDR family oxidoreductase [Acidimicrobiia bacterium]|nr:SDR family oxidoreductase [Acidimicrobiia bacterium]